MPGAQQYRYISQDRWRMHKKYVRRLRRKLRSKSQSLQQCQERIRGMDRMERMLGFVIGKWK